MDLTDLLNSRGFDPAALNPNHNLYKQLDIKTIQELLIQDKHGFSTWNNGDGVIWNYGSHFHLFTILNGYLIENYGRLRIEYGITEDNFSFDKISKYILKVELSRKQAELITLIYKKYELESN